MILRQTFKSSMGDTREIYEDGGNGWCLKAVGKKSWFGDWWTGKRHPYWGSKPSYFKTYDEVKTSYETLTKRKIPPLPDSPVESIMVNAAIVCNDEKCVCTKDDIMIRGCPYQTQKRLEADKLRDKERGWAL